MWVCAAPRGDYKGYGFSSVLIIKRVSILAILVMNRVWLLGVANGKCETRRRDKRFSFLARDVLTFRLRD